MFSCPSSFSWQAFSLFGSAAEGYSPLSKKTYPAWRKIVERAVLSIVILVAVTITGYTAFNAIAVHSFWARNPPLGKLIDVDGHRMYIDCTGRFTHSYPGGRWRRMTPRYGMGFSLLCQRRPGFVVMIGLDLVGVIRGQPHGMQTILLQNCTGFCYGPASSAPLS